MDDTDAQANSVWPELEAIAQPARERRRLPPEQRSEIIVRLCSVAPLSVKELSTLLDRSEAYVGDAIRPLVNERQLTFLFPDQPRHPKQKYLANKPATAAAPPPAPPAPASPPAAIPIAVPAPSPIPVTRPPATPVQPQPLSPYKSQQKDHAHPAPARYPNAWMNQVVLIVVGIVLGRSHASPWLLVAALTALGLSATHIIANSAQYALYRALSPTRRRALTFVLLKSSVALLEISLVYLLAAR